MQADKVIQSYVIHNYGNLVTPSEAKFDQQSKTWVAELKADYPRIIRDDLKPKERILKFLALRQLGEVRLTEDLRVSEATTRDECVNKVDTLLTRWRQVAEEIIVSASASQLAKIGMVKDTLNPIVMIISNFLRKSKETITFDEIETEPRRHRMMQYFNFLAHIKLLEPTSKGFRYSPLFAQMRQSSPNSEEFKNAVVGYILKNYYTTIKGVFAISRFEPFVHMDSCYYIPALQAEEMLAKKEDSLIDQYSDWYGGASQMRLRSILDELVRVEVLKRENDFYYGQDTVWNDMLSLKDRLPAELMPLRV